MGSGAAGYTAFLSYSHRDAAAAKRLHRRLEAYRMPRRLVGSEGGRGPVPARLAPIFRDREELPAAGDLTQEVRAALAASRALIVVCSPHSAASPWVGREIAAFRELHPDRPILAAILDGEPGQCFPPDLTRGAAGEAVEPLAADLRREGDGERLGLLKLVAGLAGVPLDALVQRDAQRRIRRVTAVTAVALAAMLMMAVLTVFAVQARTEAQRQRAEAEGLVEFMLTDLRDRLREVGRLDVHGAVNERAIAYYAAEGDIRELSDESLKRRARVLHAMGEDDDKAGRKDSALARFREAYATTAEILERHSRDPEAIFAHAQSEYWLGYMAFTAKDWPTTERHWAGYRILAEQLAGIDSRNPEWLREAAYAVGNLCTLELVRKTSAADALRSCEAAVAKMSDVQTLLPADKKAASDLANRYGWLSNAWEQLGRPEEQFAALTRQESLLRPLVASEPDDAQLQDQWMRTLLSLAEFLHENGRTSRADAYRARARDVAERLIDHDPANTKWRKWLHRINGEMPSA